MLFGVLRFEISSTIFLNLDLVSLRLLIYTVIFGNISLGKGDNTYMKVNVIPPSSLYIKRLIDMDHPKSKRVEIVLPRFADIEERKRMI